MAASVLPTDQAILEELRLIRRLTTAQLLHQLTEAETAQPEKIRLLAAAGVSPKEIGSLLGITANAVSVAKTRLGKGKASSPKSPSVRGTK